MVLEATSPWDDLLPTSLLQGIKLNGDQISFLMKELGMDERLLGLSLKDREGALFEHVFMGRSEDLIRAREAHARPAREEEFIPEGSTLEALEEVADQDASAVQELVYLIERSKAKKQAEFNELVLVLQSFVFVSRSSFT